MRLQISISDESYINIHSFDNTFDAIYYDIPNMPGQFDIDDENR